MAEESSAIGNPNWRFRNIKSLLIACIGMMYGPNPEERLDDIRSDRARVGTRIANILKLESEHVVVDLGSGCGFVGRAIAPLVKHLYCLDVSLDFLNFCRDELSEFPNVSCFHIDYADLSAITTSAIDRGYSTAVFIHFNFYDIIYYLAEINRILKMGGLFSLDILNSDTLDVNAHPHLRLQLNNYRHYRHDVIFNVLQPFSLSAFENISRQLGFVIENTWADARTSNTLVLLRKTADATLVALAKS